MEGEIEEDPRCSLHINTKDLTLDHNVALPTDVLADLLRDGTVGASTAEHVSVMGYQAAGLRTWRWETAPVIARFLQEQRTDGVVLVPI